MLKILYHFMCYVLLSNAARVSFIKPCKPSDTPCMIASAQSAIENLWPGAPEFHLPPLDPLSIGDVRNDDRNLIFGLKNIKIYGASKCKFLNLTRDLSKSTINITAECPIRSTGQYDFKGKLLFIEAFGDGDFEIKTNRVILHIQTNIKTIENSGVKHWKITGFEYSYDLVEKVDIILHNLFDGDDTRAKPILEVINHSWKEITIEIGDPIFKQLLDKMCHIVNKFYQAVPTDNFEIV